MLGRSGLYPDIPLAQDIGNVEQVIGPELKLETVKNHIKVNQSYQSSVPGIWAVGDVIGPPWLAHVAHHEAVNCVERIFGVSDETIDYRNIPGCTYTHPQVASMGLTERRARERARVRASVIHPGALDGARRSSDHQ